MTFRLSPLPTFFTAIGLILLLGLGSWQTLRYFEKLSFENARDARADLPILAANPDHLSSGEADFRDIRLHGLWQKEPVFLIKHRIFEGQPGFWVINAFTLESGGPSILVNRGWIPFNYDESLLSSLLDDLPDEEVAISGLLHRLDRVIADKAFRTSLQTKDLTFPRIMSLETYDIDAMNAALPGRAIARPIILTLETSGNPSREFPRASLEHITAPYLTSETHLGYAITWFTLAAALLGIWFAHGFGLLVSNSFSAPGEKRSRLPGSRQA